MTILVWALPRHNLVVRLPYQPQMEAAVKRTTIVMCVLGAGVLFGGPARATDWEANCPRWLIDPEYGTWANLQDEWEEPEGHWAGRYLTTTPSVYLFEVSPCNP